MLGTGTSVGIPVIACDCAVCTSDDPRNKRLRCGLQVEMGGTSILVDTPTDLRQQALRYGIERVDAVLYTHAHADHIYGLDEVRIFNYRQRQAIPCYGSQTTLNAIREVFSYVFEEGQAGGGKPKLTLHEVEGPFSVGNMRIVPVPVLHGQLEVLGYRFGNFAYITDCSAISQSSIDLLRDVEILVLGALRYRPHSTHFTIGEAIDLAQKLEVPRTILTHLGHEVDHGNPELELPPAVEFGFDGLQIRL
jgi:phosphoribosyl 1,2-cyclic phosphate phosphodiesterase